MRSSLRIAHVTPAYFAPGSVIGGGERYVYYLAQCLRTAGHFEQSVFAMGVAKDRFEHDGITVQVLHNESLLPSKMDAFSAALWQDLKGFDLVHIHQSLTTFGAYTLAIVHSLGIPTVGTDLGGGENTLMLKGRGIELLDGVISISQYAHNLISGFYSGPHEILIGPVDTDYFSPTASVMRDPRLVVCVGRILPHKGIDRIICALPHGLRLIIVGNVYDETYNQLLHQMAAGKDVKFINGSDDETLLSLYQSASLFVQASTALDVYGNRIAKPELMGLTTLEAMSCGLPVVVSDAGSLPELVPDTRFGRVFSDHEDLSIILKEVSAGIWPGPDAGALARAHVARVHGMETVGQRLSAFYKSVLARSRAAA